MHRLHAPQINVVHLEWNQFSESEPADIAIFKVGVPFLWFVRRNENCKLRNCGYALFEGNVQGFLIYWETLNIIETGHVAVMMSVAEF